MQDLGWEKWDTQGQLTSIIICLTGFTKQNDTSNIIFNIKFVQYILNLIYFGFDCNTT